ncbi:MAG: SCO family protein [Bacteroidetes bacterium]|nr:SCO family protein [Bacteroidota bacterium]
MRETNIFILIFLSLLLLSCGKEIPVIKDLSKSNYKLIDQDSTVFNFPKDLKGKNVIISYLFTNCPDICPLTTHNIISIKEQLDKEGITDVEYVEISFDPERDSPSVLKNYANVRGIKSNSWHFLTGNKKVIFNLLNELNVRAMPGDTTITSKGDTLYYFIHTDRISLLDKQGRLRKNFNGSKVDKDELISSLKQLN